MKDKSRSKWKFTIVLLLLLIVIGYAALNATLNINGATGIKGNTWDVHFDNVDVKDGSVEADEPELLENDTKVTFEVTLNEPGDKYEFTVDAVNAGTIDAMIETVTKTELTATQVKYVNLTIAYEDGTEIKAKDLLSVNASETILVSVEYKEDLTEEDLPTSDDPIDVSLEIEYVQADDTAVSRTPSKVWEAVTGDGTNVGDEIAIGEEHFYVISNDGSKISALAKYNLLVGNEIDSDSWVAAVISNPTGKQDSTARGYVAGAEKTVGTVAFSNTNGWPYSNNDIIDIQAYDGPVKTAINAYKEILPKGVDVRLITKSELEGLGCSSSSYSCSSAPSWVYSTSYWSSSAVASDDRYVWFVYSDGCFSIDYFVSDDYYGVRPVISLES